MIHKAQACLRKRLCGVELPLEIFGYEKERTTLLEIVKRSAELGESNSILIIGPRGSGKSMILKSVLEEVTKSKKARENLLQVHLNGLLQTDDKIALKEITRQLHLENAVGDRVFGTFSENLQFLLDALKSGGKHTKSILFVLDEFDLFAHHKNQTLLYNLFDVSQSAQAPVCVVGLTARLDVIELLEKRVKSRFSHRQLHLLAGYTFTQYMEAFVSMLRLPADFCDKKYMQNWNKSLVVLKSEGAILDVLRKQYNLDRDIRALQQLMILPLGLLSEENPYLRASHFVDSANQKNFDSKAAMLHGISVLELCLIIAMKHITELYDSEPFNFEMVYKEYQKFTQRRASVQSFEKSVVLKSFEHLCALELVCSTDGSNSKVQKEYRQMSLLVDSTQISDALQRYPGCPTDVMQWAQSSI